MLYSLEKISFYFRIYFLNVVKAVEKKAVAAEIPTAEHITQQKIPHSRNTTQQKYPTADKY